MVEDKSVSPAHHHRVIGMRAPAIGADDAVNLVAVLGNQMFNENLPPGRCLDGGGLVGGYVNVILPSGVVSVGIPGD